MYGRGILTLSNKIRTLKLHNPIFTSRFFLCTDNKCYHLSTPCVSVLWAVRRIRDACFLVLRHSSPPQTGWPSLSRRTGTVPGQPTQDLTSESRHDSNTLSQCLWSDQSPAGCRRHRDRVMDPICCPQTNRGDRERVSHLCLLWWVSSEWWRPQANPGN